MSDIIKGMEILPVVRLDVVHEVILKIATVADLNADQRRKIINHCIMFDVVMTQDELPPDRIINMAILRSEQLLAELT